jgi:hypothetical protein
MYCPQCRSEYREEFTRCSTCDVALVGELDALPEAEGLRMVFETADPACEPVVESVLRGAGVDFLMKNGALMSTMPGANTSVGAVQFWVQADDEDEVRALLESSGVASTEQIGGSEE